MHLQLFLFSNFLGESDVVLGGLHHLVELVGRTTLLLVLGSLLLLLLFLGLLLLVILFLLLLVLFVLCLLLLFLLGLLFLAISSLLLFSGLLLGSFHLLSHLLHVRHLASIAAGLLALASFLILAGLAALLLGFALLVRFLDLLSSLLGALLCFLQGLIDHFIVGLDAALDLREGARLVFLASRLAQGSVVIGLDINLSFHAGRTNANSICLSQREAS